MLSGLDCCVSCQLAGCGKTLWARQNFIGLYVWNNRSTPRRMLKKARLLTRPTPAGTSPAHPESAKTASSPKDAPFRRQGRSSVADPRFTPHVSRLLGARRERRWQAFSASWLDGFEDLAATQAARANSNAFRLTVDQCPNWLEVGLEDPLGLVIGVTDVMAGLATFATEIACKCHGYTPSSSRIDARSRRSECITGLFVLTSKFHGVGQRRIGASGLWKGD